MEYLVAELQVLLVSQSPTYHNHPSRVVSTLNATVSPSHSTQLFLAFSHLCRNKMLMLAKCPPYRLLDLLHAVPALEDHDISATLSRKLLRAISHSLREELHSLEGITPTIDEDGVTIPPYVSHSLQQSPDSPLPTLNAQRFTWLGSFLETFREREREGDNIEEAMLLHVTADAFLVLSCIPDVASALADARLLRVLDWAMQVTCPDPEYWRSPEHPFFRLQSATLSLIEALLNASTTSSNETFKGITDFSERLCGLVSQPPWKCEVPRPGREEHVGNRDLIFFNIILKLSGDDLDGWINDPRNDLIVRHWMFVAERRDPPMRENVQYRSLLRCHRLREPRPEWWREDMLCVHFFVLYVIRAEWKHRSKLTTDATSDSGPNLTDLVSGTLYYLEELRMPEDVAEKSEFRETVLMGNDIAIYASKTPQVAEELRPVRIATVKYLSQLLAVDSSLPDKAGVTYDRSRILGE